MQLFKGKIGIMILAVLIALTLAAGGVGIVSAFVFKGEASGPPELDQAAASQSDRRDPAEPPQNLRAFYVSPQSDFYPSADSSREQISEKLTAIFKKIKEMNFNALVLDLKWGDRFIYDGAAPATKIDALSMAMKLSEQQGIPVYPVYYLNAGGQSPVSTLDGNPAQTALREFIDKYQPDGVFLTDYYASPSPELYREYSLAGSGIGYSQWLVKRNTHRIEQAVSAAKDAGQQKVPAIGLLADPVWAPKANGGPDVTVSFTALSQGFADTKGLLEDQAVDFVAVKAYTSLTDPDAPFEKIVNWWGEQAQKANVPMFVVHDGNKVCTENPGWNGFDQLARQVASANKAKGYSGSIFTGYQRMLSDPNGSTASLLKYYKNEYKENDLFKDVTIDSPAKTTFTTEEAKVRFHGQYDPNFDVMINDVKIIPTKSGEFLEDYDLKIGVNKFVVKHKGKTITYTITRKVKVLKSVSPSGSMSVEGGSKLLFEVVAYKGSKVTATLGGKTVTLELISGTDNVDRDSSYGLYGGNMTVPAAKATEQNLGQLKVTGKYSGFTETMRGGTVKVKKQEVPSVPNVPEETFDPNAPEPDIQYDLSKQVRFNEDNTVIYDGDVAGAEYGSPEKNTLPKGTIDYIQSETSENYSFFDKGRIDFYVLKSGKKVKKSAVTRTGGIEVGNNHLSDCKVTSSGQFTTIQFASKWKAPFDVSFDGVKYHSSGSHLYFVDSFKPQTVTITFDYATKAPIIPDSAFDNSPLFMAGRWTRTVENGVPKLKLKLTLRKAGQYYGCAPSYDANGNLILKFNNPPKTLSGLKVVLDPGHGKGDAGAVGSYTQNGQKVIVYERDLNWQIATLLKQQLEAEGATVLMYDSKSDNTSQTPSLSKRVAFGRKNQPHLYISVHHNSGSSTARGAEVYYTNPFSKPLANAINTQLNAYYKNSIYGGGSISNLTDKYSEFYVTRVHEYASVLVEYGFVSNPTELAKISNPAYQRGLANATVQGIKNYLQ